MIYIGRAPGSAGYDTWKVTTGDKLLLSYNLDNCNCEPTIPAEEHTFEVYFGPEGNACSGFGTGFTFSVPWTAGPVEKCSTFQFQLRQKFTLYQNTATGAYCKVWGMVESQGFPAGTCPKTNETKCHQGCDD